MPRTVKTLNHFCAARKGVTNSKIAVSRDTSRAGNPQKLHSPRGLQAGNRGSIRPRRVPKGEHSIETEAIDRLSNTDLLDMPCHRGLFVAEFINQLEVNRLAAGKHPSVRDFFKLRVVHAAAFLHQPFE